MMSATEAKNSSEMKALPPESTQQQEGVDPEVVIHLFPNDVLFGRGSGPNDHEGNIRFRLLVGERKEEYMATNHRQTKANIARNIVNQVLALNGRFLKRLEAADAKRLGIPKGVDAWTPADEETIMEKAKQALRQQREKGVDRSPNHSPVPQPKATQAPAQIRLENFSVQPPFGSSRPKEIQIASMDRIYSGSPLSSDYSPAMRQHNPYEPIPIGTYSEAPVDWLGYPSTNVPSNDPSYAQAYNVVQPQHQIEQLQAAQQFHHLAATIPMLSPPSTQMADNQDRHIVYRVGELTDSLNKLKTKNEYSSELNESIETMGTIEPIPLHGSRDTSAMSSSTLSFMKSALDSNRSDSIKSMGSNEPSKSSIGSDPRYDPIIYDPRADFIRSSGRCELSEAEKIAAQGLDRLDRDPSLDPRRASINIEDRDFFLRNSLRRSSQKLGASADMSMTLSQVWRDDKRQVFHNHTINEGNEEEEQEIRKKAEGKPLEDPRPVDIMDDEPDNMSSLGKSSMSILNIAMGESVDSVMLSVPDDSIFSDFGDL